MDEKKLNNTMLIILTALACPLALPLVVPMVVDKEA